MEQPIHTLANLFEQLGLKSSPEDIDAFIASHAPIQEGLAISEAPFWTPAQAAFLKEEILEDADWAIVVDELSTLLHPHR